MNNFDKHVKIFNSFVDNINENEKVAIIAHAKCNDGMVSSIFLNEILRSKYPSLHKPLLLFRDYDLSLFDNLSGILKKDGVNKVFILDICINNEIAVQFEQFCNDFDVCYVDHHPSNASLPFVKNLIKTETPDCTSLMIYKFGEKYLNKKSFNELLCAAMVSEFSYVKKENLAILQKFYPDFTVEKISLSKPFALSSSIGSAAIYYKNDTALAYELLSNFRFSEIDSIHKEVSEEVEKHLKAFEKTESYFDKKLFFYRFESHLSIGSRLSTILSVKYPNAVIIVFSASDSNPSLIKVSSRCQIEPLPYSMSDLLKAGTKGFENATTGGHVRASGGSFLKKDLEVFKKQVIRFVEEKIRL